MTREEAIARIRIHKNVHKMDEPRAINISEALDMAIKVLEQEPCEDCISRVDALRVAKNEYLRGWHNALCKALSEKYSIHCEEGNFSVIQEETITGLGLSMDCAVGKDVESYIGTIPRVTPQEPNTWSLDDAREDFMYDVYKTLESLPTNDEANKIIDSFDRVTGGIRQEPILDEIRNEIAHSHEWAFSREEILRIIDKYKESDKK